MALYWLLLLLPAICAVLAARKIGGNSEANGLLSVPSNSLGMWLFGLLLVIIVLLIEVLQQLNQKFRLFDVLIIDYILQYVN